MDEKEMTSQESLELIARMISKARKDYVESGLSALLWGSVIPICSGVTYINHWLNWPALEYIWFLTIAAVIPQIIIAVREAKARKYRSHEDHMGGIWISYAIAVFLFGFIFGHFEKAQDAQPALYLTLYAVPTFATGYVRRFPPMIVGGIACWVLAIVSMYVGFPNTMLCMMAAALVAWFIPGLILRKRYLHAKETHVQRS